MTCSNSDPLEQSLAWFRAARFGLFVHWGLYSQAAGAWRGQDCPGISEWIMSRLQIPLADYRTLADTFEPRAFDARAWVRLAQAAGARYLVVTAKHHDGFAMYHSDCDAYNIVDATPFGRDPIAELAAACADAGLPFGLYYSHAQDWQHPHGMGNTWDFGPDEHKDFSRYLEEKCLPQLRELLTGYGPLCLLWFDTPKGISREQCRRIADLVHELQPGCLVSGRIGGGAGDYASVGDNQHPAEALREGGWETPCTMNTTWGYKATDRNWSSTEELLDRLVGCASKGINYLLNIGPDACGVVPEPSVTRLQEIGGWLTTNGEAIFGTEPGPAPYDIGGLPMTMRGRRLYVHLPTGGASVVRLPALGSTVTQAGVLGCDEPVEIAPAVSPTDGAHCIMKLPAAGADLSHPVLALDCEALPVIERRIHAEGDGVIRLPAHLAEQALAGSDRVNIIGLAAAWLNPETCFTWSFPVEQPGSYELWIEANVPVHKALETGPYHLQITVDGESPRAVTLPRLYELSERDGHANQDRRYLLCTFQFDSTGTHRLALRLAEPVAAEAQHIPLTGLRLQPAEQRRP